MPMPRGFQFKVCPSCRKRGVSLYHNWSGPNTPAKWCCRYCGWVATDQRAETQLAQANPEKKPEGSGNPYANIPDDE